MTTTDSAAAASPPRVAAIVLGAGASIRMGRPKQLMPVDGVPMLARTVAVARAAGCEPIVVVLGRDADACRESLAGHNDTILITNADWASGIGTSLRAGAAALPLDVRSAFVLLADQPHVTAATLARLATAARQSRAPVAVAAFADTLGPPLLVADDYLARLRDWRDVRGAKSLWLDHPADVTRVDCPEAADDIDTPADYDRLTGRVR